MSESEATLHFEAYLEEFTSCLTTVATTCSTSISNNNSQQEELFRQCHEILQQLAVEARSVDDSLTKRHLLQRVQQEKSRLAALEQEYERKSLMTGASSDPSGGDGAQAKQLSAHLQQTEDRMARQNETLERARRTMQETEAVGMEVTHELGQNRAKIESVQGSVRELSSLTDQAGTLLKSMSKPWWRR
jgi:chromosome segregation ATPase